MLFKIFTHSLGMATIHKKCGPVPGQNSLDAEIGGCAMLMDNLHKWVTKRVNGHYVLQWCLLPICMLHFSEECSTRVLWVSGGSGVRWFEVRGGVWQRVGPSVCQN